jgi:carotenoid 1,2-hydratase
VFSPYYAWSRRRDPLDHCAVNVALYGPRGARWAMTERGRASLARSRDRLAIGRSALSWDGAALTIDLDEVAAPIPRRIRGVVRVEPEFLHPDAFALDARGRHAWRPIAPAARVSVALAAPDLAWRGHGYLDANAGAESLSEGFSRWSWSRARLSDGAAILYDAERRAGDPLSLALRFDRTGRCEPFAPPPPAELPRTRWRLARRTRSEDGRAAVARDFEDTPFYSRSLVATRLCGERAVCVHESLSLDRFDLALVRLMLPFRMPRR